MSAPHTIVIVGSGLAGVTAAGTLRDQGFDGRIVLVGEEQDLPYDRPPLSKSVLVHDHLESLVASHLPGDLSLRAPREIDLHPFSWYGQQRVDLMLGRAAIELDTQRRSIRLGGGTELSYDQLLLAPGSRPRRLHSAESGPVKHLYLRTLHDALQLRNHLRPGSKIVLIGGGVIGMEVAASAVLRDCDVTVVEFSPRIMTRALCAPVARILEAHHRARGVKVHFNAQAIGQVSEPAPGIALNDGQVLRADLILIGVGVVPNTELAMNAGLKCEDGILVDEFGATGAADVYAAGDAVRYPDSFFGREVRSENWMHAQNHAAAVARNMLGAREPYRDIQRMWSDQYDFKIQTAGIYDAPGQVLRGSMQDLKFLLFHLSGGKVVGATGVNQPRDMKHAQSLIERCADIDPELLSDPAFNLKEASRQSRT